MHEIATRLADWIVSGTIPPGTLLRQIDLSERLGVSRTPLREALRILERDGLIRSANGNKTLEVVQLSADEMYEIYELREVVDGLAARLLARRGADEATAATLRESVAAMEAATVNADFVAYRPHHFRFHTLIAEACGNARVAALLPMIRLSSQMSVSRTAMAELEGHGQPTDDVRDTLTGLLMQGNQGHAAILEAILDQDDARAEEVARQHIRHGRKGIRLIQDKARH